MELWRRYQRVGIYVAVGGCLAMTYSLLTAALILTHAIESPLAASALASIATIPLSFLAHSRTTYRDISPDRSHLPRFALVALCTFLISTITMQVTISLGWPFWVALVLCWALVPVGNFAVTAIWVFRTQTLLGMNARGVDRKKLG